jgi:hypothetical protein
MNAKFGHFQCKSLRLLSVALFLPSADSKAVCRKPWNHFPTTTTPDFIEMKL